MRNISITNQALLTNARSQGLVPRQFFWITVKDRSTGVPTSFGLWTGDYTISADVISGTTGATVERTYTGGVNLEIGPISRVSNLSIQTVNVKLSAIADICQEIVRGYEPRLAKVEIHAGWLSVSDRLLADAAEIDFLGEVDGSPIETGAVGEDSTITLRIVSDAISMLARTNPRKRSYEGQKRRSEDEFSLYANSVKNWKIPWGETDANAS